MTEPSKERRNFVLYVAFFAACLAFAALLYAWMCWPGCPVSHTWAYLLAAVPALLICLQGFFIFASRPRLNEDKNRLTEDQERSERADSERSTRQPPQGGDELSNSVTERRSELRRNVAQGAKEEVESRFGIPLISFDYFLPAVLNLVAGWISIYLLVHPGILTNLGVPTEILEGSVYGALGAYTYVLIFLGERTFQRDITQGAAIWSTVQLSLGPVLGGVTAAALEGTTQVQGFTRVAVFFFAGLFPREIVSIIQAAVRRLFGTQRIVARTLPLQQIRGVSPRVEERLLEEGITDGYMLAMANPIRLQRNTPYDFRQILCWIDECLLYAMVPDLADALQKLGVTGAIDLAHYWDIVPEPRRNPSIELMANRCGVAKEILVDVIRRLNEDAQVQLIWWLYQSADDDDEEEEGAEEED